MTCSRSGYLSLALVQIDLYFQAVRNVNDLTCMSVPSKYLAIGDFHAYYSGALKAPYLTVFVGGNHEASNYLSELFYGGWVAPNIYYLGAANVIRCGPLRIVGLSGIWKGYSYKKSHYERIPYNQDDVKSVYHVREIDVRKLMQVRTQVDLGISHDWPRDVEWKGDWRQLFRCKPGFEEEAKAHQLGSVGAKYVMDRLRPKHWFAAHMHAKFAAVVKYETGNAAGKGNPTISTQELQLTNGGQNSDEIAIDIDGDDAGAQNGDSKSPPAAIQNDDEINLEIDADEAAPALAQHNGSITVEKDVRALLPESFLRPEMSEKKSEPTSIPVEITNTTTQFLALDKCLPKRHFLQLLEIEPIGGGGNPEPKHRLTYDKEWLAISRVFAPDLTFGDPTARMPEDKGEAHYARMIEAQERWVEDNLVKKNLMNVPQNFAMTAPPYDLAQGINNRQQPREYTNPQTAAYCKMLEIAIPFDASEEDREERWRRGPAGGVSGRGGRGRAGSRGGNRGRGRGGGRGGGRGYR